MHCLEFSVLDAHLIRWIECKIEGGGRMEAILVGSKAAFTLPYEPGYTGHRKSWRARVHSRLLSQVHKNQLKNQLQESPSIVPAHEAKSEKPKQMTRVSTDA